MSTDTLSNPQAPRNDPRRSDAALPRLGFWLNTVNLVGIIAILVIVSVLVFGLGELRADWVRYSNQNHARLAAIGDIESSLWYGGMVHQYNSFVETRDPAHAERFDESAHKARAAIASYRTSGDLSLMETEALDQLGGLIESWAAAFEQLSTHEGSREFHYWEADGRQSGSVDLLVRAMAEQEALQIEQMRERMATYRSTGISTGAIAIVIIFGAGIPLVRRMEHRIASHARHLEYARREAERANAFKTDFLANMSHEIRTPMNAILGYAELLDDNEALAADRGHAADAMRAIRANADHLLSIINDILDVSKIEAGQLTLEQLETDPSGVIAQVASLLTAHANEKGLDLEIRYETVVPERIRTDPTRLRQILLNLVGNAIKFTEKGSVRVSVACEPESRLMRFTVEDTGIGMSPQQLHSVTRFSPFTQGDTSTTRRFGGSGLGLRISNALAEMLGGRLEADSQLGEGSRFSFTISTGELTAAPMRTPAGQGEPRPSHPRQTHAPHADERPSGTAPLSGISILVAEDGPDNQRLIEHHLRKAGAIVSIYENGRLAIEAMRSASEGITPQLILMDMQMPEMDGYAATRELRRLGFHLPILALTAHAMDGDRERCIAAGCNDFLTKPVRGQHLVERCVAWTVGRDEAAA